VSKQSLIPLVAGWRVLLVESGYYLDWKLVSPSHETMSANLAPADIRDAFRNWLRA